MTVRDHAWAAAAWARSRLKPRGVVSEETGTLWLSVSELGWQATFRAAGELPETSHESWSDANVAVTVTEALRRAVRAVPRGQRERLRAVHLLIADPETCVIDNRAARIKSSDGPAIAQVGCQELGVERVLHSFLPFGQSSEHEIERGTYAFLSAERAKEYLVALDQLAVKVVEIVPSVLFELGEVGPRGTVSVELRTTSSTLLFADPETGHVLCRDVPYGSLSFASALADGLSVSVKEAADGLQRRICFPPEAGAVEGVAPMTATERALGPVLGGLRAELLRSLQFFLHDRLAGAPELLVVKGEIDRVRGLRPWVERAIGLASSSAVPPHQRFDAGSFAPGLNLLQTAPPGLLTIGKVAYRFIDGRFTLDQAVAPRATLPAHARRDAVQSLRAWLTQPFSIGSAIPAVGVALFALLLWATISGVASPLDDASRALSAAQAEDAALREALLRREAQGSRPVDVPVLAWFDKLSAIAKAMPDGMRLTRIAAAGSDPAHEDRFVLDGEAASNGDTIGGISRFIERLSRDEAFMRNVAAITFGGAEPAEGRARELLRFTVNVTMSPASGAAPVRRGRG